VNLAQHQGHRPTRGTFQIGKQLQVADENLKHWEGVRQEIDKQIESMLDDGVFIHDFWDQWKAGQAVRMESLWAVQKAVSFLINMRQSFDFSSVGGEFWIKRKVVAN
jgi:hypothetical protein